MKVHAVWVQRADEELIPLLCRDAGPLFGYVLRLLGGDRQLAEDVRRTDLPTVGGRLLTNTG